MTARPTVSKQISLAFSFAFTIAISLWANPTLAGDPFRTSSTSNPRNIGNKTEAAFNELFQKGNYQTAKRYLIEAESSEANEPLTHAMRGSLAYLERDWNTLQSSASKTLETAQTLKEQDPLRGNLYIAVGYFLEGTYLYEKEGPIPAVTKLQQVFQYIDAAEKASADDPELNLLKGYMDLILAVNLPFSNPEQAIERLEKHAAPDYLVNRGIAVAYRDLKQYDKALKFVDQALQETPDNPELYYLKGQILRKQGKNTSNLSLLQQALTYFDKALAKTEQLPATILKSLRHEREQVQKEITKFGSSNS